MRNYGVPNRSHSQCALIDEGQVKIKRRGRERERERKREREREREREKEKERDICRKNETFSVKRGE